MTITLLLIFITTTLIGLTWVTYESGYDHPSRPFRALARVWFAIEDTVTAASDRFWKFVLPSRRSS